MKSPIVTVSIFVLMAGCSGAATNSPALVEVNSADYGDTNSLMEVVELERNANTSQLKLTYKEMGSSVGSSMFIMRGFYKVAKCRGTEYFTVLKEWNDKDGGRLYIGGFTNKKNPDIQAEFGKEFSSTRKDGRPRRFMSVTQCDMLWGSRKNAKP